MSPSPSRSPIAISAVGVLPKDCPESVKVPLPLLSQILIPDVDLSGSIMSRSPSPSTSATSTSIDQAEPSDWLESTKAGVMSIGVEGSASRPATAVSIALGVMVNLTSIPEGLLAVLEPPP